MIGWLRHDQGYSLIEVITVLTILSIVLGAITSVFVAASNAELGMNRRFQAQTDARLALDKLRREVHCASSATPTGTSTSIALTLPTYCRTGTGTVTWCVLGSGQRFALYRSPTDPCNTSDARFADYLTSQDVFTYTAQSTASLATLHVELPVDLKPTDGARGYELRDDIVLRNSTRS